MKAKLQLKQFNSDTSPMFLLFFRRTKSKNYEKYESTDIDAAIPQSISLERKQHHWN